MPEIKLGLISGGRRPGWRPGCAPRAVGAEPCCACTADVRPGRRTANASSWADGREGRYSTKCRSFSLHEIWSPHTHVTVSTTGTCTANAQHKHKRRGGSKYMLAVQLLEQRLYLPGSVAARREVSGGAWRRWHMQTQCGAKRRGGRRGGCATCRRRDDTRGGEAGYRSRRCHTKTMSSFTIHSRLNGA